VNTETRTTDAKARLVLPTSFANATVIVEQLSEIEVRVRRITGPAGQKLPLAEESATPLSNRDRDRFLKLLAHPPSPNRALKRAANRHKARRA
jgi:hypothetical protein